MTFGGSDVRLDPMPPAAAVQSPNAGSAPIRVMVVDDSVVARGTMTRWVDGEPDMRMVAVLHSGREAIDAVERHHPDVVVLDVTMPDMDGITALPLLLCKQRDLVVLMASTLTRRNAEISLRALALGAADYVPKPESRYDPDSVAVFRRDLIEKIRGLAARRRRGRDGARPSAASLPPRVAGESEAPVVRLRPPPSARPRALVIGASTGGPQALDTILAHVGAVIDRVPVLITQHMPPTFTAILAEHLARLSGRPVREAVDGDPVRPGSIHLARGGCHMRVVRRSGTPVIALDDGPPVNFCKPAVDLLFSSAAEVWGAGLLALVLTGMGRDGSGGAADIVAAGGSVIVQDDGSSVVWGMPGCVANAGLASAVLPLERIAPHLVSAICGGRP